MQSDRDFTHLTYLTTDGIATGVARSQVAPIVNELAQRGWPVTLVSCEQNTSDVERAKLLLNPNIDFHASAITRTGALGGLLDLWHLRRRSRVEGLVHARSDLAFLASVRLRRRNRVVWDSRSFWAEQKFVSGLTSRKNPAFQVMNGVEGLAARTGDGMVALSERGMAAMGDKWGVLPKFREVIPTLVDASVFVQSDLPQCSRIEVLFSGSYNRFYDLQLSSDFVRVLSRRVPTFVTWASESVVNADALLPVKVDNLRRLSYDQLPDVIADHHVGIAVTRLDAGRSLTMAMPTKIAEFLASGRPVVVSAGLGDMDAFVLKHRVGVSLMDFRPEGLDQSASELLDILGDPETPNRCRSLAEEHFSLTRGVDRLEHLYRRVIKAD